MKIWVHPYHLISMAEKATDRIGALIKVEWAMHQTGYADLHPWPEFGELPLDRQIESVATLNFTPLAEIAMEFSYIDREFRLHRRNAFLGMILPRSHHLVLDIQSVGPKEIKKWQALGFTHVKVKLGLDLDRESSALATLVPGSGLSWRLDFNGRLTAAEADRWWRSLAPAVKERVDFLEDPVREGAVTAGGPWADDWYRQKLSRTKIVKPAREAAEELGAYDRVVFTHGLDHPLGQASALWSAAQFYGDRPKLMDVGGLAAPDCFAPNEFSNVWSCSGPRMKPPPGTGFGFDDLLESLKWERVL